MVIMFRDNRLVIPMGCKWHGRMYQLDADAYNCSAEQARLRWTAEGLFGNVVQTPSLQGELSISFMKYLEAAHRVSYLNVLCYNYSIPPKGWKK